MQPLDPLQPVVPARPPRRQPGHGQEPVPGRDDRHREDPADERDRKRPADDDDHLIDEYA
ncbi:MAG: hypothetical protein R6W80_06615 [Haliea sp.]